MPRTGLPSGPMTGLSPIIESAVAVVERDPRPVRVLEPELQVQIAVGRQERGTVERQRSEANHFARLVKRLVGDEMRDVDRPGERHALGQHALAVVVRVGDDFKVQVRARLHLFPERRGQLEARRRRRMVVRFAG